MKLTPDQRARLILNHGTEAGYSAHRRRRTVDDAEACGCKQAHREYINRKRREARERGEDPRGPRRKPQAPVLVWVKGPHGVWRGVWLRAEVGNLKEY